MYVIAAVCVVASLSGLLHVFVDRVFVEPRVAAGGGSSPSGGGPQQLSAVKLAFGNVRMFAQQLRRRKGGSGCTWRVIASYPAQFWILTFGAMLSHSLGVAVVLLGPRFFVAEYGSTTQMGGVMVAVVKASSMLMLVPIGGFFDRRGSRALVVGVSDVLFAAAIAAFAAVATPSAALPMVTAGLVGFVSAAVRGFGLPALSLILPAGRVKVAMSHFLLVWGLGQAVVPLVAGVVAGLGGSRLAFYLTSLALVLVALSFALLTVLDRRATRGELERGLRAAAGLHSLPTVRYVLAAKQAGLEPAGLGSRAKLRYRRARTAF